MRVESPKQTKNGGYFHTLKSDPTFVLSRRPVIHNHDLASPDHIDAIYSTLIRGHLVLSNEHREKLLKRGLSIEDIENNGYRSTPTEAFASNIARALSKDDLRGVPGFYRDGQWKMVNPGRGILIPVRDSRHRIRAFQVRRDEGETRYLWFSSANKPEGQTSGAPIHFAHPERIREQGTAIITEGALKADVISALLGCGVIAFAGVTTFPDGTGKRLRRAFPELREIQIAYDGDYRENASVNRAVFRLISDLRWAGFAPTLLSWPPEYKGLDDYLVAA